MNEIWKDIPGYEGKYMVSNFGRVKSLKFNKEKILKPSKDTDGYLMVCLYENNKSKQYTVHKLVAMAFMGECISEIYCDINHIDEDKTNNRLSNLQYCTHKYNMNYGTRIEKYAKSVIGINKSNGYICEYSSSMEVQRSLGIAQQNVTACCKGKLKSAGGYIWMYKENYKEVNK